MAVIPPFTNERLPETNQEGILQSDKEKGAR